MSGDDGVDEQPPRPARPGLTAETFEALLARLDPDRERAGRLYEEIRRKLVRLFEWRGCDFPEDLTDETFNRVARRLSEGVGLQASDPYGYFCGVAYKVFKEVWRRRERERRQIEAEKPSRLGVAAFDFAAEEDDDGKLGALRRCLGRLPTEDRRLILQYYESDDRIRGRRQLAEQQGIALNALRIRAHRLRKKVESCLKESQRQ